MTFGQSGKIRLELLGGALVPAAALLTITIAHFGVGRGIVASAGFVMSLLAHEGGHLLAALMNGTRFSAIGFCLYGAYIRRERAEGLAEFLISAAGPAANIAIAAFIFYTTNSAGWMVRANLALAVTNLLPFGNSDGQRMLNLVREHVRTSAGEFFKAKPESV